MPCTTPRSSRTESSTPSLETSRQMQYNRMSLNDIHYDGIGRPILPNATFIAPQCSAISSYLDHFRLSSEENAHKLPAIPKSTNPSCSRKHSRLYIMKQLCPEQIVSPSEAVKVQQNCSRNKIPPEIVVTLKQDYSRNNFTPEIVVTPKQNYSQNNVKPDTVLMSKQNCSRNNSTPEIVSTPKQNCPRTITLNGFRKNCTPEIIITPKKMCYRNKTATEIVSTHKPSYFLNNIKLDSMSNSKQTYSRNNTTLHFMPNYKQNCSPRNMTPNIVVTYKQSCPSKPTLPTTYSTSNQSHQIPELPADLKNKDCSLLKPGILNPAGRTHTPRSHPQLRFRDDTLFEAMTTTNSKKVPLESDVATHSELSARDDFNPHPFDDAGSRKLYTPSRTTPLPNLYSFQSALNFVPKKHKRKRKRNKGLKMSLSATKPIPGLPFAPQHRSLQEMQHELQIIRTDLNSIVTPNSMSQQRVNMRRRIVTRSLTAYRSKKSNDRSFWINKSNYCRTKSLSTGQRISWGKKRRRKRKKLRIVGQAIRPVEGAAVS